MYFIKEAEWVNIQRKYHCQGLKQKVRDVFKSTTIQILHLTSAEVFLSYVRRKKRGYQLPHKNNYVIQFFLKKNLFQLQYFHHAD